MPSYQYQFPTRQLVAQAEQATIEPARIPRSVFHNRWTRKSTFTAGYLVPFLVDEILPGDHMDYDVTAYVRMATPLFPIFDSQNIDTFFFFVPNRLVWDNWVKFMGEQKNPTDSIAYTVPKAVAQIGGENVNGLWDHFGLPIREQLDPSSAIQANALPFRAYALIWNQWFRDQNVDNSITIPTGDGPDLAPTWSNLLFRRKIHDYFTTCLPWPNKFTSPGIPLGGLAPVTGLGFWNHAVDAGALGAAETGGIVTNYTNHTQGFHNTPGAGLGYVAVAQDAAGYPAVYADLARAASISINTLRQAFMIQGLLERDARGGTRYVELIWSHFGVRNPDFRLQRPEYIGGGSSPLTITPIAQTAPGTSSVVGQLGAAGTAAGKHRASYAATEHGFIIGLMNVRTELSYGQGQHKQWLRNTRYDYYFPDTAGLGEQAVLNNEIYCKGVAADSNVFGYQERWQEYRTRYSEITGMFRSGITGTLDAWHLGQNFVITPSLVSAFLSDNPPVDRVTAAGISGINQQYLADILIQRKATRPIPTFGTPVTLGRF